MTTTGSTAIAGDVEPSREDPAEQRILRASAQLAGTAVLAGSIATLVALVLTFAFPVLFLLFMVPWPFVPLAAASGGIAGGAGLAVVRVLGWSVRVEAVVVASAAALGSIPVLLAVSALSSGISPWLGVAWIAAAVVATAYGHRRTLRHPLDEWRPVLVRLLVGVGLAIAIAGVFLLPSARWFGGSLPAILALGGVLLLCGILISLGPFPSRTSAGLAWAGFTLLVASIMAVMVGVTLQSQFTAPAASPPPPAVWGGDPADFDPTTDRPREPGANDVPPPTLEEGRAQFAALAAATIDAAGPDARWRDEPGVVVSEVDCGDGSTALRIDAEFAMGEITDTTTDEQDRAVTEANLAAADRIVVAWSEAGLGTPEVLHGEPILGGAGTSAVDYAKVDFAFGVAQPRIEGRCLPNGQPAG